MRGRAQSGMTLLEVLVALAVLGLLLAALSALSRYTFGISAIRIRNAEAKAESIPGLDYLERVVADSRPIAPAPGRAVAFTGREDGLILVAPLPAGLRAPAGLHQLRLSARDGALRLAWSALGANGRGGEAVLLPHVASARFRYFGANPGGAAAWQTGWQNRTTLPSLVGITVTPSEGLRSSELIVPLRVTGTASSNVR